MLFLENSYNFGYILWLIYLFFTGVFFFLGGVFFFRWIVNYDFDLLDGLVIGVVLGVYMLFLVGEMLLIFIFKREELISVYN